MAKLHFIVYLDILGVKNKINSEQSNEYLQKIQKIYTQALELFEQYKNLGGGNELKCKIFSDNIIFATEIYNQQYSGFCNNINSVIVTSLAIFTIFLYQYALEEGFLIRGGMTVGDLFINDVFTYGKGLIRAYQLENEIAIFPRVILDEQVLKYIDKVNSTNLNGCKIYENDFDNYYYINYLSYLFKTLEIEKLNNLLREIKKEKKSEKIKQKHNWLITKYNEICTIQNKEDFIINIDPTRNPLENIIIK